MAVREGDEAILNYLLKVNPNAPVTVSKNGRTPLHTACLHGQLNSVLCILKTNPELAKIKDSCGATPILDAVRGGHLEVLDLMAKQNPSLIHDQDALERDALDIASHSGHWQLVEHLIKSHGMNVNKIGKSMSPLHWAAKEGHIEAISTLLTYGADPNAVDNSGRCPLFMAVGGQHVEAARVLMNHDPLAPFDVTVLPLARSASMKTMLSETFQSLWNITLFLPGTH